MTKICLFLAQIDDYGSNRGIAIEGEITVNSERWKALDPDQKRHYLNFRANIFLLRNIRYFAITDEEDEEYEEEDSSMSDDIPIYNIADICPDFARMVEFVEGPNYVYDDWIEKELQGDP